MNRRWLRDILLWAGLVVAVCLAIIHSVVIIFHSVTGNQPTPSASGSDTVATSISYQEQSPTSSESFQDWVDPVSSLIRRGWEILEVDYRKEDNTVRVLAVKRLPEEI